jgi:hypothetical protein
MPEPDLTFVIPTYRLRDVSETVEKYDESFWNSGHSPRIIVFDDSTVANHEKYYPLLEKTKTRNDLFYVGPHEKEQFIALVNRRLRDRKLEAAVRNLFRPSYGGNRNFTLIYTLGNYMVSSDDDMRPDGLIEDSPESLVADEISRGKLIKHASGGYTQKTFDILSAFADVLGKKVGDVPENFAQGELVVDTAMELETNVSKGLARQNSLLLQKGKVSARGRCADAHQEQLHAPSLGFRGVQRGGGESAQAQDPVELQTPERPQHRVRLRGRGDDAG